MAEKMTNAELFEALKIAEANYAHWNKRASRLFYLPEDEVNEEYWEEKVRQLRKILDQRLRC